MILLVAKSRLYREMWDKEKYYLFNVLQWTKEREIFLFFKHISLGLTANDFLICSEQDWTISRIEEMLSTILAKLPPFYFTRLIIIMECHLQKSF